jgi:FRG domain-containing protein
MPTNWPTTVLDDLQQADDLLQDLEVRRWASRGQSEEYERLTPSIDRGDLSGVSRQDKLKLERRSVELFGRMARFLAAGEEGSRFDDIITLMVLRHHGARTRLLDWTGSALIAAHFACLGPHDKNGELWAFDFRGYEVLGKRQWKDHPETTIDGSGADDKFDAKLTAFTVNEVLDWFCCALYPVGFPRQNSQKGYYSLTRLFGVDHAVAIARLLKDTTLFHRYVIAAALKPRLRKLLLEKYYIWRGALFPDSSGAAKTVETEVFGKWP